MRSTTGSTVRRAVARIASAAVALSLAAGLAGLAAPSRADAAYPGANGDIVFASDRAPGAGVHIFRMKPNGTGVVQLTFGSAIDLEPAWSPGGTKIAFTRYATPTSTGDIYVMNADGSGLRRVTDHAADEWGPSWAADGHRIYFTGDRLQRGNYDVFVMDRDGANVQAVAASGYFDGYVSGHAAVEIMFHFTSNRSGELRVYRHFYYGGTPQTIPTRNNPLGADSHPAQFGIVYETWVLNSEEGFFHSPAIWATDEINQQFELTEPEGAIGPAFSPDGTKVIYASPIADPDPTDDVAVFDLYVKDGYIGPVTKLTNNTSSYAIDPNWQTIPEFPLVDAKFHPNDPDIRWLHSSGITSGCEAELYCPRAAVTRAQMAAFLARAWELPPATKDYFTDDGASIFEEAINRVAEAGIATGCGGGRFCPLAIVSRAEMAAFISRALDLPPTETDYFSDDDGMLLEGHINRFAEAGITGGCAPGAFCPTSPVTRGQMAAFLHRALEP